MNLIFEFTARRFRRAFLPHNFMPNGWKYYYHNRTRFLDCLDKSKRLQKPRIMKYLLFLLLIVVAASCQKTEIITPCTIDLLNGNWEMTERLIEENEMNLPDGFSFSVTPVGNEMYEFELAGNVDTLKYDPDFSSPEYYPFVFGCKFFHFIYTIENDTMDLWFSSPYSDGVGTNNYKLVNTDCP